MEISNIVQYGTAGVAIYTLYEILYKQARWRSAAETKLESIDVTWKPQVNQRLDTAEERLNTFDKALIQQNREILVELRAMNSNITKMDKNLALAVQAREHLEERVDKIEIEDK